MKVFVTGGSGFVGGHVIEALIATGNPVPAMARSDRSAAIVESYGATAVRCSLEDITAEHLAGVDAVVHVAAHVEEHGPHAAFHAMNVEGTQRVLDAARAAGVRRFIQVSSNATVHDGSGQLGVDEQAPYTRLPWFAYGTTKAEAERRVLAANDAQLTTVALRPCFVWGPRDTTLAPALERMVEDGSFVWVDGGRARVSTTHVANLVHAIQRALVADADAIGGQAFFIADDGDTDMRGFLSGLASSRGVTLQGRSLPGWLVRGAASTLEATWSLLGRDEAPPITRMAAMLMAADMTVDSSRARNALGWQPVIDRTTAVAQLAA